MSSVCSCPRKEGSPKITWCGKCSERNNRIESFLMKAEEMLAQQPDENGMFASMGAIEMRVTRDDVSALVDVISVAREVDMLRGSLSYLLTLIEQRDARIDELRGACKKAAEIFRDYERIHLAKTPPNRAKAERNGGYAYVLETYIESSTPQGETEGGVEL